MATEFWIRIRSVGKLFPRAFQQPSSKLCYATLNINVFFSVLLSNQRRHFQPDAGAKAAKE